MEIAVDYCWSIDSEIFEILLAKLKLRSCFVVLFTSQRIRSFKTKCGWHWSRLLLTSITVYFLFRRETESVGKRETIFPWDLGFGTVNYRSQNLFGDDLGFFVFNIVHPFPTSPSKIRSLHNPQPNWASLPAFCRMYAFIWTSGSGYRLQTSASSSIMSAPPIKAKVTTHNPDVLKQLIETLMCLKRLALNRARAIRETTQTISPKLTINPLLWSVQAVEAEEIKIHRIRITLTSRKVEALEKVCSELKNKALSKSLKVSGPVRMPTKFLKLIVRKSPCGEGTNTYDRWQMRIHKRILDIHSPADVVRQITNISIEPGVDIEVIIVEDQ